MMTRFFNTIRNLSLFFIIFLLPITLARAVSPDQGASPLYGSARLLLEPISEKDASQLSAVVELPLRSGWHTYWKNPGQTGQAPQFFWSLPSGISVAAIEWPLPKEFASAADSGVPSIHTFGYDGTVRWLVRFALDPSAPALSEGAALPELTLKVSWLACSEDQCLPQETLMIGRMAARGQSTSADELFFQVEKEAQKNIPPLDSSVQLFVDMDRKNILMVLPDGLPAVPSEVGAAKLFVEADPSDGFVQSSASAELLFSSEAAIALRLPLSEAGLEALLKQKSLSGFFSIGQAAGRFQNVSVMPMQDEIRSRFMSAPVEESTSETLLLIALFAFLGGIILNAMPCVLPVVGLKVLHLISLNKKRLAQGSQAEHPFRYGISFTAGVLFSFWILVAILYGVQYFGSALGWGFQLQEPSFVIALILILFAMSLSFFGLYEFGVELGAKVALAEESLKETVKSWNSESEEAAPNAVSNAVFNKGWLSPEHLVSFTSGFFVTLIATPCTGPFLGSVFGFVTSLHPWQGLIVFSCLALGVAFPYLLLTACPPLLRLVPKPGPWMDSFKKILGFLLIATIIWLSWVLQAQVAELSLPLFLSMLFCVAVAAWIWAGWAALSESRPVRYITRLLVFALASTSVLLAAYIVNPEWVCRYCSSESSQIHWKPFSAEALSAALKEEKVVLVEVTAKWCLTCQLNQAVFLSRDVQAALASRGVETMVADWTRKDPEITLFLRKHGRNGVPACFLFVPSHPETPIILPEILTPASIISALEQIKH